MDSRGGRARALAALSVMVAAAASIGSLSWPSPEPGCAKIAGISEADQVRIVCLDRAKALALHDKSHRFSEIDIKEGSLVFMEGSGRIGRLRLGIRRALGLSSDPNFLSSTDYEEISGLGPKLARRIVESRTERGGFRSLEDLAEVRGVGATRMSSLRVALTPVMHQAP